MHDSQTPGQEQFLGVGDALGYSRRACAACPQRFLAREHSLLYGGRYHQRLTVCERRGSVMCGIAGVVTRPDVLPDEGLIRRMIASIAHRGPDGEGVWVRPGIGLGHRRLAILDLSPSGAQPMSTQDGAYTITYNGEIYNYRGLREELVRLGSRFTSTSDTEIILEAYRHWDKECVKRLRGMFAFALWDAQQQRCFFARDRIGKKPFFYRILEDGTFAFASEIKALIPLGPVSVDLCALRAFIGLQYVPAPMTGFRDIVSLVQGHRGMAAAEGLTIEAYHSWNDITAPQGGDVSTDIVSLLDNAVQVRLQADVPVGVFLSGGVDSAAVVALASRHLDHPLRTFTMGFPTMRLDERREARQIAKTFATDHREFEASPRDLVSLLEQIIDQYDAPFADASALPLLLLARETAKEVKVVLTGDGGDELFGGYRRYLIYAWIVRLASLTPAWLDRPLAGLLARVWYDPRVPRAADTLKEAQLNPARAYGELFCGSYFSSRRSAEVFTPDFLGVTRGCDPIRTFEEVMGRAADPLEQAMWFDLSSYLPDDLNVKMDRATMAHGLEARAPFLDQHVVAYALRLTSSDKVRGGQTKIALKRALHGLLPPQALQRGKRGFEVPLFEWFQGPLKDYWRERCLAPQAPLKEYVHVHAAARLFEENLRGANHGNRLWMLLALATWLERWSA